MVHEDRKYCEECVGFHIEGQLIPRKMRESSKVKHFNHRWGLQKSGRVYCMTCQRKRAKKYNSRLTRAARGVSPEMQVTPAKKKAILDTVDRCPKCQRLWEEIPLGKLRVTSVSWDHIIPLARGGKHSMDNLQPMCLSCNSKKGSRKIKNEQGKRKNEEI